MWFLMFYRASENIFAMLPSLNYVKEALSEANIWLRSSKPYLVSTCASSSLRTVEELKVHFLSCQFNVFTFAENLYTVYMIV